VRLGADIGLRCVTCNRRVLLERSVLEKRLKQRLGGEEVVPDIEKGEGPFPPSKGAPRARTNDQASGAISSVGAIRAG
jgi:hypothetical protein